VRLGIARQFTRVEDVVYVSLGVLLTGCRAVLLAAAGAEFWTNLVAGTLPGQVIDILDRILLVLMVVEILYTVQVSFRGQTLVPEPFLIIGLIAGIRRVLILTAEFKNLLQKGDTAFRNAMIELGLLAFLIIALVISIVFLRRIAPAADRS
jgi:uncharacterized membrane protein (DUF373 family)